MHAIKHRRRNPQTALFMLGVLVALVLGSDIGHAQLRFQILNRELIEQRLQHYKGNDAQREATLKMLFQEAGCAGDNLTEQRVKRLKEPNIICVLPGNSEAMIAVAGHFDHIAEGNGVVDNWSGASLLPSFYQVLRTQKPRHTFLFLGFAGEEKDLAGSRFYVKGLAPEEIKKVSALVNIDSLGLGPTKVWASHSDHRLLLALLELANAMKLAVTGVNVEKVGYSDEEPFIERKIPTITVHSITQETLGILHTPKDKYDAIRLDDYFNSYRLLCGYLAYLDKILDAQESQPQQDPSK